jgi:hypothetical protein
MGVYLVVGFSTATVRWRWAVVHATLSASASALVRSGFSDSSRPVGTAELVTELADSSWARVRSRVAKWFSRIPMPRRDPGLAGPRQCTTSRAWYHRPPIR